jgi:hypothetical protein
MGKMDDLMQTVAICEAYGWTYEQYQDQPAFFLTLIREKMVRDQKQQEMELRKMKRG